MDDNSRSNRIEHKLDKVVDQISEINVTLAAQHVSLKEHMKRTRILEEKILPMERKYFETCGIIKLVGIGTGLLAAAAALAEIIGYFKNVK